MSESAVSQELLDRDAGTGPAGSPDEVEAGTSLWRDAWHRLGKNRLAIAGLGVFAFMTLLCFLGPFLSPYGFEEQDLVYGAQGPGAAHWAGTDQLGRDLMTRIMYGGRVSLGVGFLATVVSIIIGVSYGATSAYVGGRVDALMMRIVDILYALPFTIFVILLMVLFGRNIVLLFVAIGAVEWLTMARIVRGQVMSLKKQEFIEAAMALGISNSRIVARHLIPNVLGPIIVYSTLTVPAVMLLESVISFLGLGVQPPNSSWGLLIKEGAEAMVVYPHLLIIPASFFSLTLFSLNFLGDGLRDAFDPRASKD